MRAAALVFGITSAVVVTSTALTYVAGNRVVEAQNREDAQHRSLVAIDNLFSLVQDAETGQRGFVITGDNAYLAPFDRAQKELPQTFSELETAMRDGGDDAAAVAELERLAGEKLAEMTQTIQARRDGGFASAAAVVQSGAGKAMMDNIRLTTARMRHSVDDELHREVDRAAQATRLRTGVFVSTGVINLLVLGWGFWRIRNAIHERDAAALSQQQQADLLSTTLASIGDCVIVTDNSGRITFMNAVASALTGWTQAEAISRPVHEIFNIVNEVTRQPAEDPVEKVIRLGVIVGLANHTLLIRKDGSEVPIDDSGAPIRSPKGEMEGVVLVFRDFSAHKTAERELRQAKEAAEVANEAKDKFLAMLSHELRTPLTPALATLTRWEMTDNLPASMRDDVRMMRRNLDLEARIIEDLLDLTRVSRGIVSIVHEQVDIHILVKLLLDITRSEMEAKSLKVAEQLKADRHFVVGDSARLQQVLWNLVRNAVNFTDAHGSITIQTENRDQKIVISVQDSGIGMTTETLEKLFTPFEQGSELRSRRAGGLGLGLAISHSLIELMGGKLTAQSAGIGQGSIFTIELETTDANASSADTVRIAPEKPEPQKILIVEDHVDTATTLARLLQMRGHTTRIAPSVAAAQRELATSEFDLILCDLGLPDGTGYDVITALRKTKNTPAIALTGFGMSSDVERAMIAGFDAHLIKPVNFPDLEATIRELSGSTPVKVANE